MDESLTRTEVDELKRGLIQEFSTRCDHEEDLLGIEFPVVTSTATVITREDLRTELSLFGQSMIREELAELRRGLVEELTWHGAGSLPAPWAAASDFSAPKGPVFAAEVPAFPAEFRTEAVHAAFPMTEETTDYTPSTEATEANLLGHDQINDRESSRENYARSSRQSRRVTSNKRRSQMLTDMPLPEEKHSNKRRSDMPPPEDTRSSRNFDMQAINERLQDEEVGSLSKACLHITLQPEFEQVSALVVLANAAWIGVKANHSALTWSHQEPSVYKLFDWAFALLVCGELVIRMIARGCAFWYDAGWKWNWFDTIIGLAQIADLLVHAGASLSGLKILKLVRILRIARIAQAFPDLHILISSIIESMHSLFWTLVLIFLFLYAFSLLITETVSFHKIAMGKNQIQDDENVLLQYFGSLDKTMLSLYMTLTQGIGWVDLLDPLQKYISPWMKLVFVLFIGFQLFAMMNIITACFVDNALKLAVKAEASGMIDSIWTILGGHEEVPRNEMMIAVDDFASLYDHPKMQKFLYLIGVEEYTPEFVFGLIDLDGDGGLTAEEFLQGCARLIGPAKATEMARLASESHQHLSMQDQAIERISQQSMEILSAVEDLKAELHSSIERISMSNLGLPGAMAPRPLSTLSPVKRPPGSPRHFRDD